MKILLHPVQLGPKLFGHRDSPLEEKNKRQFGYSRDNMAFEFSRIVANYLEGLFAKHDITG
jgi:hypothetical protein